MLLKSKDRIIRVLEEREGQKLIVSCTQKSMPVWISERELQGYFHHTQMRLLVNAGHLGDGKEKAEGRWDCFRLLLFSDLIEFAVCIRGL